MNIFAIIVTNLNELNLILESNKNANYLKSKMITKKEKRIRKHIYSLFEKYIDSNGLTFSFLYDFAQFANAYKIIQIANYTNSEIISFKFMDDFEIKLNTKTENVSLNLKTERNRNMRIYNIEKEFTSLENMDENYKKLILSYITTMTSIVIFNQKL